MSYSYMKVNELKGECRRLGLKVSGRKDELIERLNAQKARHMSSTNKSHSNTSNSYKRPNTNTHPPNVPMKKKAKKKERVSPEQLDLLFNQYQDPESPDEITDEGMVQFFQDLGVDLEDIVVLVLSWHMKASEMCIYSREEFQRGMTALQCSSISDLKSRLDYLRAELSESSVFAQVYTYVFDYGIERDQKSMAVDLALSLWKILLSTRFALVDAWLEFVQQSNLRVISRDVWKQTLEFSKVMKPDLSNFDPDGAWPVLLDDFVDHVQDTWAAKEKKT